MLHPSFVNADSKCRNTDCRRSGYVMRKIAKSAKAKTVIHAKTKVMGMMGILCALLVQTCLRVFLNRSFKPKSTFVKRDTR